MGGATSIDRQHRIKAWQQKEGKERQFSLSKGQDLLAPNYYWENEQPVLDAEKLEVIGELFKLNTVITHTAF